MSIIAKAKLAWQKLTGDDPMLRLSLIMSVAINATALGIFGILISLLAGFINLACWMNGTKGLDRGGDILGPSLLMLIIGLSVGSITHAVAVLYERKK